MNAIKAVQVVLVDEANNRRSLNVDFSAETRDFLYRVGEDNIAHAYRTKDEAQALIDNHGDFAAALDKMTIAKNYYEWGWQLKEASDFIAGKLAEAGAD